MMADDDKGNGRRQRAAAAQAERKAATGQASPGQAVAVKAATGDTTAYALLEGWKPKIAEALARGQDIDQFVRMAAALMAASKQANQLAKCTRPSIYTSVMQAAHYGLMPFTDEAAIIPFGDTATFVPQYQGFVQLAFRTGKVASVTAKLIYRRDTWDVAYGPSGGGFIHKPLLFDEDGNEVMRGRLGPDFKVKPGPGDDNPPILAYCYATFRDGTHTEVETISRQEAIDTRDRYSKSYQNAEKSWNGKPPKRDSFWHTDPDKAWLKTAVRRGMKYIPKSPELLELILADNAADSTIPAPMPWMPPPLPVEAGGPAAAMPGDVEYGTPGKVVSGQVDHGNGDQAWEDATPARPLDRDRDLRGIHALFDEAGWSGDDDESRAVRADVLAAILSPLAGELLTFGSTRDLTPEQADAAHRGLRAYLEEHADDKPAALPALAETVRKAREQAARPAARKPAAKDGDS
jgi:recombination protein RecT